jgi:hypothetical protein
MADEVIRVAAFDTIQFDDGDWDGPNRDEDVMTYKAKHGGASITVKKNGAVVFDADYDQGKQVRIVGSTVHLPEGGVPD